MVGQGEYAVGSYVNSQLMKGETVDVEGQMHWIGYLSGALLSLLGFILIKSTGVFGWLIVLLGIFRLVMAFIKHQHDRARTN